MYKAMQKPLIIYLEYEDGAYAAIRKGAQLAALENREVILFHVIDLRKFSIAERSDIMFRSSLLASRKEWLTAYQERLQQEGITVKSIDISFENPRKIIQTRYKADLMVVVKTKSHERRLTNALLRHPPCSVLTVHVGK